MYLYVCVFEQIICVCVYMLIFLIMYFYVCVKITFMYIIRTNFCEKLALPGIESDTLRLLGLHP